MSLGTALAKAAGSYYKQVFHQELEALQGRTFLYTDLCTPVASTRESETYGMMGSVPGMQQWISERQLKELRAADRSVTNVHYEASLRIDKNKLMDDHAGFYDPMVRNLAAEALSHPDELLMTLLSSGESTAGWDGQYFFDTDHSWGDSGTQDNDLAPSASTPTAPTSAEFKTAYHAAVVKMLSYKNDQGKYLNRTVVNANDQLTVVVPLNMLAAATEALTSVFFGGGNSNIVLQTPTIKAVPALGSTAKWYLFRTDGILRPFLIQVRTDFRTSTLHEDNDFEKEMYFGVDRRYAMDYGLWTSAVLSTFA